MVIHYKILSIWKLSVDPFSAGSIYLGQSVFLSIFVCKINVVRQVWGVTLFWFTQVCFSFNGARIEPHNNIWTDVELSSLKILLELKKLNGRHDINNIIITFIEFFTKPYIFVIKEYKKTNDTFLCIIILPRYGQLSKFAGQGSPRMQYVVPVGRPRPYSIIQ